MTAKVLIAGVAIAVMAAGVSSAKTHHKGAMSSGGSYAAPSQPIPYGQMDAYMKASPKQRTAMMGGASGSNMSSDTGMSSGSAPPASSMGSTGSDTSGAMSNSSPAPGGSMSSGSTTPPVNDGAPPMTGSTPPATPPTTPPN